VPAGPGSTGPNRAAPAASELTATIALALLASLRCGKGARPVPRAGQKTSAGSAGPEARTSRRVMDRTGIVMRFAGG
jgi:hypothetical protein